MSSERLSDLFKDSSPLSRSPLSRSPSPYSRFGIEDVNINDLRKKVSEMGFVKKDGVKPKKDDYWDFAVQGDNARDNKFFHKKEERVSEMIEFMYIYGVKNFPSLYKDLFTLYDQFTAWQEGDLEAREYLVRNSHLNKRTLVFIYADVTGLDGGINKTSAQLENDILSRHASPRKIPRPFYS